MAETFNLVHICSGDILREQVREKSILGMRAKLYMDAGKLVPDNLVIALVQEKIRSPEAQFKGFVLDGFPMSADQAYSLCDQNIEPDAFILLDAPDEVLINRCSNIRIDPVLGTLYDISEKNMELDPVLQPMLRQRIDDMEASVRTRLRDHRGAMKELQPIFKDIIKIDASQSKAAVTTEIMKAIKRARARDIILHSHREQILHSNPDKFAIFRHFDLPPLPPEEPEPQQASAREGEDGLDNIEEGVANIEDGVNNIEGVEGFTEETEDVTEGFVVATEGILGNKSSEPITQTIETETIESGTKVED